MQQTDAALIGLRVGNIRLVDVLGKGGMGTVFVGFDDRLERQVAVKAIRGEYRFRPEVKARFLREARILSQLKHPKVCTVHDYVEGEEHDFLVLELVEGRNLRQLMSHGIREDDKLAIARQLLEVLSAVHGHGVVHRDLKPENVMVAANGHIKVLDFGLARSLEEEAPLPAVDEDSCDLVDHQPAEDGTAVVAAPAQLSTPDPIRETAVAGGSLRSAYLRTRVGTILGTVGYMSPEQARGEPATPASDIYSLGLVLQELFTERPVIEPGLGPMECLLKAAAADTIPVSGLPGELSALINRMKSAAPGARPSAVDAMRLLEIFIDGPRRRRRRVVVAAIWTVLLLFAAGMGVQSLRASRAARIAQEQRQRAVGARHQAEGLMSFMLVDLAGNLEPLGKLPLLEKVAHTALEYFQSLPDEEFTEVTRRQRSMALRQVGKVLQEQGDLTNALAAFATARDIAGELAADEGDRSNQLELKDSLDHLGMALFGQGAHQEALAAFEEATTLAESMLGADEGNPELLEELSFSLNAQGIVLSHLGEMDASQAIYERALTIRREVAATRAADDPIHYAIATTLLNLGVLQADRGELEQAVARYDQALELLDGLIAIEPDNTRWLKQLALVHNNRGVALGDSGDIAAGLAAHRASLATMERLVAHDPTNATWQRDRARSLANIGATLVDLGRLDEALPEQRRALAIYRRLADSDPSNVIWRSDVATSLNAIAHVQRTLGSADNALTTFTEARAWSEQMVADFPDEQLSHRNLGDACDGVAAVMMALGRPGDALEANREAVRVRSALADSDPAHQGWRADLAVSLAAVAGSELALGTLDESVAGYHSALGILEALVEAEPHQATWRRHLAETLLGAGAAEAQAGHDDAARGLWQRAAEISTPHDPARAELRTLAAHVKARLLLGESDGAQPLVDRLATGHAIDAELRELCRERGLTVH